jgi:electron transfer flavoprotein beta subunit
MNIVVLMKAVPVIGTERLDDDWRTVRDQLEANGADEYVVEKALRLMEAHGGEVSLLTVGPPAATDALRKALAMGATRAWHVSDPAIAGSDIRATLAILEAALRRIPFDLVLCGADSSDGRGGVMGAALAARLGLPYLPDAAEVEPGADGRSVRIHRLSPSGYDVLEAPVPAIVMGTQVLGEPRYPSLRGIMAARTKETTTWALADLGIEAGRVGAAGASTRVRAVEAPAERGEAVVLQGPSDELVPGIVDFLAARGLA